MERYFQLSSSTILIMEKRIRTLFNASTIIVLAALAVARPSKTSARAASDRSKERSKPAAGCAVAMPIPEGGSDD